MWFFMLFLAAITSSLSMLQPGIAFLEEVIAINQELKGKVEELSRANNDLQNLMASTKIATIFLDGKLHIKRYTEQAKRDAKRDEAAQAKRQAEEAEQQRARHAHDAE